MQLRQKTDRRPPLEWPLLLLFGGIVPCHVLCSVSSSDEQEKVKKCREEINNKYLFRSAKASAQFRRNSKAVFVRHPQPHQNTHTQTHSKVYLGSHSEQTLHWQCKWHPETDHPELHERWISWTNSSATARNVVLRCHRSIHDLHALAHYIDGSSSSSSSTSGSRQHHHRHRSKGCTGWADLNIVLSLILTYSFNFYIMV